MNNSEIILLKENFNDVAFQLGLQVRQIAPESILATYFTHFENLVLEKSSKIIDTFVINVLPFKQKIMDGDDNFFLGQDYNELHQSNQDAMSKIFEFKNIWLTLEEDSKNSIKMYMQILAELATQYFLLFDELSKTKSKK
jgi:hypothetical protein